MYTGILQPAEHFYPSNRGRGRGCGTGTKRHRSRCNDMSKIEHRPRYSLLSSVAAIFSIVCIIAVMYFVLFHQGTPIIPAPG